MMTQLRKIPVSFLIRRSVRYLLLSHGFRLLQAVAILAALSFVLTGSRIAFIDHYGNRADIVTFARSRIGQQSYRKSFRVAGPRLAA